MRSRRSIAEVSQKKADWHVAAPAAAKPGRAQKSPGVYLAVAFVATRVQELSRLSVSVRRIIAYPRALPVPRTRGAGHWQFVIITAEADNERLRTRYEPLGAAAMMWEDDIFPADAFVALLADVPHPSIWPDNTGASQRQRAGRSMQAMQAVAGKA